MEEYLSLTMTGRDPVRVEEHLFIWLFVKMKYYND